VQGDSRVVTNNLQNYLVIQYPSRTTALRAPNAARAVDLYYTKLVLGLQRYKILEESLVDLKPSLVLSYAKLI
jgi:hypothetical protein